MNEKLITIGDQIDRLMTIDVPARGVIGELYSAARQKYKDPLSITAANMLRTRVNPNDVVFIATGWPDRPHITPDIAETDGPPGATSLARGLHVGLNAVPIILIESQLVEPMKKTLSASGLKILSPEGAIEASRSHVPIHAASVISFPTDHEEAKVKSKMLLDKYKPAAVTVIEKGGMNEKGNIHTSRGHDTTEHMSKIDYLIREAALRDILTIGIGDGGNEIGYGVIQDFIITNLPFGDRCVCPCEGGIAPSTETDMLITASVSNWGAYGITAALAVLLQNPYVLQDIEMEERILTRASHAGFIDGVTGFTTPSADGLNVHTNKAFIQILTEIVKQNLSNTWESQRNGKTIS